MTAEPRPPLDGYFKQAATWAQDREDMLRSSRRIAWIVAGVAAIVAICEALALMLLMPLKRVEPYTLLVDRQTGFVQQLKPLNPELVSAERALTQSFLVQYVIAREGFDVDTVRNDYRKVALWSGGQARADYLSMMPASNPASPLARYPRSTIIEVRVKSATPLGKDSAMVRFDTVRHDSGRGDGAAQPWVAAIRYSFSGAPMSVSDRFVNPLGFQVTRYRVSPEALAPSAPPPGGTPQ